MAIDDPRFVWFIDRGAVDLFLVERRDGAEQSAPQHLLRAESGRLLPGVAPQVEGTALSLIAKGLPGSLLRRLPIESLSAVGIAELGEQIDTWLMDVSSMLCRDVPHQPRPDAVLTSGEPPTARNGTLAARRGVVWAKELPLGAGLFMDLVDPADAASEGGSGTGAVPLTPMTWLVLLQEVSVSVESSESLAEQNLLFSALGAFHRVALSLERLNRSLAVADQANLERARVSNRLDAEEGARRGLFNLYGLLAPGAGDGGDSGLREVLRLIGRREGIDFQWPAKTAPSDPADALPGILDASGVRGRRVRLAPEDRWWVGDSGSMLAFRVEDDRPVALLPGVLGNYRQVDPVGPGASRVTAESAQSLRPEAWMFYPPLPASRAGPRDLLRVARKGLRADWLRFVLTGVLGGLVLLLPAVVVGFVADEVIPSGEAALLYGVTAALAGFALIRALLQVLQGMALMRLEGRVTSRIEAAFWDRLLRLPPGFLHQYPAGELAQRGMTFQSLRDAVQGVATNSVLSIGFLAPALLLVSFYDPALGGVAFSFALLSLLVTVALGLRQIRPHGRMLRAVQGLSGRLFQLINGISKLRVEAAEGSAFAVWARSFREQKKSELQLGGLETQQQAFGAALPFLAGAVLLLATTLFGRPNLTVGDFLVVFTLFMLFQTAVVRLGSSFSAVAAIRPALDQIQPLLAEPLETSAEGDPVEVLGGEIAFDHVSFRYDPEGPLILEDVSIHAKPGEFVAIAGESGAGKSTLFRLALGLDKPSGGSVYYDGRDLKNLNLKQVRRQIGAVPQAVQLHPQDLWDNIVGDRLEATEEDAWQAARLAAVDRQIAAMPMGMLTPVGASAAVTSGGESQRIRIAHALLRNPRILLLDEATNWLDNETQSRIMQNLERLTSTRIVIAHRLSTLQHADRIYVMRAGKVVQSGSFAELANTEGVFRNLVQRQIA
ncbi:MAG: ATP-binding cassette domain-containing protein [Proteobacteria bacterium]|nr:ATP-binding cassette domain-containing protein [Pseudomonadota bacterium]